MSDRTDGDQFHIRGDHSFTPSDQLMVRLSYANSDDVAPNIAYNGQTTCNKPRGGVVGYTKLISASAVNDLRFGMQRYAFDLLPDGLGTDLVRPLGLPVFGAPESVLRFPAIGIRNYSSLGGNAAIPVIRAENNYQWLDNLSWQLGRHSLKFGGDARLSQYNNLQPQTVSGQYTFNGPFTAVRGSQYVNGLGDLLLGLPSSQSILNMSGYHPQYLRNLRLNLFVQDDIQVSRRLTMNAGLRWERDGAWREKYNRWAYFDFGTGEVVYPKGVATTFTSFPYPHRFNGTQDMTRPTDKHFAPRLGLAFRPFSDNSTVIRAAYGIFWAQSVGNPISNSSGTPPPFFLREAQNSSTTTPDLRLGVFAGADVPAIPSFFTHDPFDFTNGYVQQWNFGIERQVLSDVALKASYVGSRGANLEMRYEGNAALPPGPGPLQNRRLYPRMGSLTTTAPAADSWYHSLQLTAEKRFRRGLQFLAGYTWAKALDTASSWGGLGSENFLPQDPLRWDLEKGRASHDLKHRFTLSYVYQLPVHFQTKALDLVLGGWESSGLVTLQSGFPFTVRAGGDLANIGAGANNARANVIGDPRLDNPTIARRTWADRARLISRTSLFSSTGSGCRSRCLFSAGS